MRRCSAALRNVRAAGRSAGLVAVCFPSLAGGCSAVPAGGSRAPVVRSRRTRACDAARTARPSAISQNVER
eukprot:5746910-Prymnesium_polylepis.1